MVFERVFIQPEKMEEQRARAEAKRRVVSVSLNEDEQETLRSIRRTLGAESDSQAIKLCAIVGMQSLHLLKLDEILAFCLKRKGI